LGLVGHAFEMARDHHERIERLETDLVFLVELDQVGNEASLQRVHSFLGGHRLASERSVLIDEGPYRIAQHGNGKISNLLKSLERSRHIRGFKFQYLAGNPFGIVAHTLQFEIDPDRGVNETKRTGDRLLADKELETEPVELLFQLVNPLVTEDHSIG